MLKTSSLHIQLHFGNEGEYFLSAVTEDGEVLPGADWRDILFSHHKESWYGTTLTIRERDQIEVNAWQLVTLFTNESFNSFVQWDWDEHLEVLFAASPVMYDSITEREWLPNFSVWHEGIFQWSLPQRVKDEFAPVFWDRQLAESNSYEFVESFFHDSLSAYLESNPELKEQWHEMLELLENNGLYAKQMADYFDEESWLEWIGIKENGLAFTIGLRLEEPSEDGGWWTLETVLRDRSDHDILVGFKDQANYPSAWSGVEDAVAREHERWLKLLPWLEDVDGMRSEITEEEAWMFLTDASELLVAVGVEILLPSWWIAMKNMNLKVKAKVRGNSSNRPSFVGLNALVDFDWKFSMNGADLSEEEFRKLVEEKRRLVFVRGRWIKLDPAFIKNIQELMSRADKQGIHVQDLIQQELLGAGLDDGENPEDELRVQFELNRQWKHLVSALSDTKEIPEIVLPEGLHGELRPYQKQGLDWLSFLRNYGFGAVLADDMGLGKTIQLISYLLAVKEQGVTSPSLIICPTSVLGNWQKELERFGPDLRVLLHYGATRFKGEGFAQCIAEYDVVLTSYGLSHLDYEELSDVTWSSITLDEAQNIKNATTKQSRAVRKLNGQHHIALTGTPMENRLSELWSIFDFTNHGYLGGISQFQKRFVAPIEKENDTEKVRELQALIRPFLLRRTKKDEDVALNLPDKLEQKEYIPLTGEQASLYEQLVQDTIEKIAKLSGFERKGLVLQMLSQLKQLCNHPALYLKETNPKQLMERSEKLEKLAELVEAVLEQGESCIIFTQYIDMGEMIKEVVKSKFGHDVPFLNGSVPKAKRDEMIERFQNHEFPIFLLSLKAGGTGLNLTAANHVIHYDRWWNPAVENQATDRAYRIGQKRFVHVHKLICTGTLEEKIDLMLEKKQALNDEIIQSDNWITELNETELHDLIKLG